MDFDKINVQIQEDISYTKVTYGVYNIFSIYLVLGLHLHVWTALLRSTVTTL